MMQPVMLIPLATNNVQEQTLLVEFSQAVQTVIQTMDVQEIISETITAQVIL